MIALRTSDEIRKMRRAGELVGRVLDRMGEMTTAGISTKELDTEAHEIILSEGGKPAFLGYRGYPATLCVSINDEVVHGIPGVRKLENGMIVSIDVGTVLDGYYGDSARTFAVGEIPEDVHRLLDITQEALAAGINVARPGNRVGAIGAAVSHVAERENLGVVRALTGHGIGTQMHESPQIPNFGSPDEGDRIEAGMVFAIEPMLNLGGHDVEFLPDGWTVKTKDGSFSAHFEHTVAVTDDGPDILTKAVRVSHG
jgi:methionyl aminopeptidase